MKNKNSLYTLWSFAIVVCVFLSIFVLIFASCAKPGTETEGKKGKIEVTDETPQPQQSQEPENVQTEAPKESQQPQDTAPETPSARLGETEDAGQSYVDKLTFLGDSTTYGLKYYEMLSGGKNTTQVWTPASGTLTLYYQSIATIVYPETGEEIPIIDAVTRKKPEYMVITLGVNGVSSMDEEYFTSEYTDLVQKIQQASPDTKLILNSIYPVAASYQYIDSINNEKISAANGWIEKIAENTGTRYLNTYEVLVGSDGYLPESYHNGDGLHLNPESFGIVLNYIRTHEYK